MTQLEQSVVRYLEEFRNRKLILGLSGGADSVALFRLLQAHHDNFECAHCNFMLRGEESLRDEDFVKELCAKYDVTLNLIRFDVPQYINDHPGESCEMACRELRYGWWRELLKERDADLIVLGHHSDDNIETMLMNLFRGSGPAGLSGIPQKTAMAIRPLYDFSRNDILGYLASIGQDYIVDSTNLESDYRRNFIRNELLPLIETRWPGVRKAMRSTSRFMQEEHRIVTAALDNIAPPGSTSLDMESIKSFPSQETLLHHFLAPALPSSSQISEIIRCISRNTLAGKRWKTSTYRIDGERDGLHILPLDEQDKPIPQFSAQKFITDNVILEKIRSHNGHDSAWLPIPPENYIIRKFQKGDRIHPLGMKGSRLISDIMKDAKLTAVERINTIVFENPDTHRIVWAVGLCRSRFDLISEKNKEVWLISEV